MFLTNINIMPDWQRYAAFSAAFSRKPGQTIANGGGTKFILNKKNRSQMKTVFYSKT
jgi:hypothetical protein